MDVEKQRFIEALEHLYEMAQVDSGGGKVSANFLLSLWNGAQVWMPLDELYRLDVVNRDAVITVLTYLLRNQKFLRNYIDPRERMKPIQRVWRNLGRHHDAARITEGDLI